MVAPVMVPLSQRMWSPSAQDWQLWQLPPNQPTATLQGGGEGGRDRGMDRGRNGRREVLRDGRTDGGREGRVRWERGK